MHRKATCSMWQHCERRDATREKKVVVVLEELDYEVEEENVEVAEVVKKRKGEGCMRKQDTKSTLTSCENGGPSYANETLGLITTAATNNNSIPVELLVGIDNKIDFRLVCSKCVFAGTCIGLMIVVVIVKVEIVDAVVNSTGGVVSRVVDVSKDDDDDDSGDCNDDDDDDDDDDDTADDDDDDDDDEDHHSVSKEEEEEVEEDVVDHHHHNNNNDDDDNDADDDADDDEVDDDEVDDDGEVDA
ncbi:hypothetical protein M0804_009351 [Polistes exclamans]|nr:hypothetical protein M0804_009351 [Polistes exclamans]